MSCPTSVPAFSDPTGGLINILFLSLIEIQAFMARLVREFQFSVPEGKQIRVCRPGVLIPTVVGEENKGGQLPLRVSAVRRGMDPDA